jgi:hypothetical protein
MWWETARNDRDLIFEGKLVGLRQHGVARTVIHCRRGVVSIASSCALEKWP